MNRITAFALLTALLLLTGGCGITRQAISTDEKTGKVMLLGSHPWQALHDTAFAGWFNTNYGSYTPDAATMTQLGKFPKTYSITIVLGTWCGDSKEQVPRFKKVLDGIAYPADSVQLLFVDRKKEGLAHETEGLAITLVPTFIVYRGGKEIGRIIETPKETLEADLLQILFN